MVELGGHRGRGDALTVAPLNVSVKFSKHTEELKAFDSKHLETQQVVGLHGHLPTHPSVRLSLHHPSFYFMHFKASDNISALLPRWFFISQSPTAACGFSCKFVDGEMTGSPLCLGSLAQDLSVNLFRATFTAVVVPPAPPHSLCCGLLAPPFSWLPPARQAERAGH